MVEMKAWEREKARLTPSSVRLPIRAHLSMTIFVSGNIALSHAPSLLNSSARPCLKPMRLPSFTVLHDSGKDTEKKA